MLGGGKSAFTPDYEIEDRFNYDSGYVWNCSSQTTDFIEEFKSSERHHFVETKDELMSINARETDRLLGLFNDYHLLYDHERADKSVEEYPDSPSLANMTKKVLEMLMKNTDQGFVLLVEGGRIDHAHHGTYANRALDETLIIVTADHGHTMNMAGYQSRGRDIRSFVDDGLPYAILSYAQCKGYYEHTYSNEDGPTRVD